MRAYERLLNYVTVDTTSQETETCPSTPNQKVLGQMLVDELKTLGAEKPFMDEHGYVYAWIPAKNRPDAPVMGLIAHMDTSNAVPGGPIVPRIIENYDGGDITLANGLTIDVKDFAWLPDYKGQSLIVTDGNTLLGADDKAGVAEIMTVAEKLLAPDAPDHGPIAIAFTPDEEIGRGADKFDVPGFGAEYAYTVDGGSLGEVEYENFNAASLTVTVTGQNIHPGSAKNKMIHASLIAMEYNRMLPPAEIPAHTEGYEGFFHLCDMQGDEEKAVLHYIIRDHDKEKFEARKALAVQIGEYLNLRWPGRIDVKVKDSYANMKEMLLDHMEIVDKAKAAFEACGVEPKVCPIRGGTDGARLSYMGLPCPNLSTGAHNCHGRKELVSVQAMDKMVDVLLTLCQ